MPEQTIEQKMAEDAEEMEITIRRRVKANSECSEALVAFLRQYPADVCFAAWKSAGPIFGWRCP